MRKVLIILIAMIFIPISLICFLPTNVQAIDLEVPQDDLHAHYTGTVQGDNLELHAAYYKIDDTYYNGEMKLTTDSYSCNGYFVVNINNRVVTNTYGSCAYQPGSHDPGWIIVDGLQINDTVYISMDGIGDYEYIVVDDNDAVNALGQIITCFRLYHPYSKSLMYYDKESGILIDASKYNYSDTVYNWKIDKYYIGEEKPTLEKIFESIPGYEHILTMTSIAVIITIIGTRKKLNNNKK